MTNSQYKILIEENVFKKIMYWVRRGAQDQHEVSGFAPLELEEATKTFILKDAFMLSQTVSAAETEIDPQALGKAMFEYKDQPLGLKCHWHSHPNMNVFFSPTDHELIEELGGESWLLALVFNEKAEIKSGLYTTGNDSFKRKLSYLEEDLPVKVLGHNPDKEKWDEEFDRCVTVDSTWFPKNVKDISKGKQFTFPTSPSKPKNFKNGRTALLKTFMDEVDQIRHLMPDALADPLSFDDEGWAHVEAFRKEMFSPFKGKERPLGRENILKSVENNMCEEDVYYIAASDPTFFNFCTANLEDLYEKQIIGVTSTH